MLLIDQAACLIHSQSNHFLYRDCTSELIPAVVYEKAYVFTTPFGNRMPIIKTEYCIESESIKGYPILVQ